MLWADGLFSNITGLSRAAGGSARGRPDLRRAAASAQRKRSQREAVGARAEAAYRQKMSSDPLRDRFERVDGDGNGKIDQTELGLLLDALGVGFSDAQVRATFEAIDVNRSGLIELEEFRAWWTTR